MTKQPLRLEWIEAGSLAENPANWRKHSPEQLQTIKDLLADTEIGWAGACLYNERTKRLIDGHARRNVADPKTPIPVLVGDWSEEAERKILATLDPVGAMAMGDPAAYAALIESLNAESLWVRDLLHNTAAGLTAIAPDQEEAPEQAASLSQMECQPFEHYDYVMLVFKNEQDFQQACERLDIKKVQLTYPGGHTKIGLGRVIDGGRALAKLCPQPALPAATPPPAGETITPAAETIPPKPETKPASKSKDETDHPHQRPRRRHPR